MKLKIQFTWAAVAILLFACGLVFADDNHHHGHQEKDVKPPRIFLDKNPRIVKYQLGRLDNTRLLLVERKADDKKYLLVHEEILLRDGMSAGDREEALNAIAKINGSGTVAELLKLIPSLNAEKADESRVAKQLVGLLLGQPADQLKESAGGLKDAIQSDSSLLQQAGYAGLIVAGDTEMAVKLGSSSNDATAGLLKSIQYLPTVKLRNSLHGMVSEAATSEGDDGIRLSAIAALGTMTADRASDFKKISPMVEDEKFRAAAVKTLLKVPRKAKDKVVSERLADFLVKFAEDTPAAERTSDSFVEAMQLADQVMSIIPKEKSQLLRKRLDAVTVRVVLLHAVEEEMRYDVPWFAVEAGRDVQIVLVNEDLMAHNLVITTPGSLQDVALEGAAIGPKIGPSGLQYVPDSEKVVAATEMIQAEKRGKITFTAPNEPGEYPYVCTFPGHWMRMYGVMVVVEDLAEFERNPVEPKDPVGSNRALVKAWTINDFKGKIEAGLKGRNAKIGQKIFEEATCALCHKVGDLGRNVGPELTDVWSRWKGDAEGVLREIVEPSHKIEPKYIVRKIITFDGDVISGIVMAEDKDTISILPNPESKEPTVIKQDDIDDMVKSSVSIMPKGLVDRFTEDEIMELLNYLKEADGNR